ncbi:WD40-repeat-containing domain protein [Butyriboletus roseoflavus]|nr:WD40-repeat-containing domain protein [Butyriboletus roseoflavus]
MMSSTKTDPTIVLDTGSSRVRAVTFHPDGKHILGGSNDGIQRWRLEDGQEVGKQTGMRLNAISVTKNYKWIVCGIENGGANVWDEEMQKKVLHVEGRDDVNAVDVSPDSTTFATGIDEAVSVWLIPSGERLFGPLAHDFYVTAVRFSPNGERFATASCGCSIRIFDSRSGDELITIETVTPSTWPITPLAWSNDGQQIFAASADNKIKLFDVLTGSQLAESQTLNGDGVYSVALAASGKFIATFADSTILIPGHVDSLTH